MTIRRNREALVAIVLGLSILVAGIDITLHAGCAANASAIHPDVAVAGPIQPSSIDMGAKWYRTRGGIDGDYGTGIWSDGTAVYACGYIAGLGGSAGYLVKLDRDGNEIWNSQWNTTHSEYFNGIIGFGSAVYTCGYGFNGSINRIILVKWNAVTGNQAWNRTWNGTMTTYGNAVWADATGIYVAGQYGNANPDVILAKWDAAGNQLWSKTWSKTGYDYANAVQGDGSSIYTCGDTDNDSAGYDMLLVKWDATTGNEVWNKTCNMNQTTDSGRGIWLHGTSIFTCGWTHVGDAMSSDDNQLLVKWDAATGNIEWNHTFGGPDSDAATSIWSNGTAIFTAGSASRISGGDTDLAVVKWDMAGNVLGSITWGGVNGDDGVAIFGIGSEIYTCGWTESFGAGDKDMVVIKFMRESPTGGLPTDAGWIIAVVVIGAIGGGIVLLYFLDKKGIINLKPLLGKIRGLFSSKERARG
jgi:hypothetical protein